LSGLENPKPLPLPAHFNPEKVNQVWKVDYATRAKDAQSWAKKQRIKPAFQDKLKVALVAIDVQNTFCIPGFELFVAGQSGNAAVEDNRRLCEFIYRNMGVITHITVTLDTHHAIQIFHPLFLVDKKGEHPAPLTLVSYEDVQQGRWRFNPKVADSLGITVEYGQEHLLHYTQELQERQKYDLTIWPYHVMLGSIGHALVASVEEAVFFHSVARYSQASFDIKGSNPLTEHYSAVGPEVLDGPYGEQIAQKSTGFLEILINYDAVIITGQAKSHCVAWTIDDLLVASLQYDERLVQKVYLLEDCTSPVVVPGVVDYSAQAEVAFERFSHAGMHVVRSIEPIQSWLKL